MIKIGIEKTTLEFDININKNEIEEKKEFIIPLYEFGLIDKSKYYNLILLKKYYRGKDGFIIIYDITERKTFESIENLINEVKNNEYNNPTQKIIFMLVGNKLDLVNKK